MGFTFISGATGGLGKAFVLECARRGDNLFLTGRKDGALEKLRHELLDLYPDLKVEYFACNLCDESSRKEMFDYIVRLDIKLSRVINVAGVDIQKAFEKYTEQKIITQVRVNVEASFSVTKFALDNRAESLEIITISSMSAMCPMPYFAIYSSTKSAQISFYRALRAELKGSGVKVTVVAPGGIPTRPDIIEDIKGQGLWGKLSSKSPEFVAVKSLKAVKKNKALYIPGFFNRFLNFLMKLAPKKLKIWFIAKRWKKLEKDAF